MPSFDVVSSPDIQEIDNAINNTKEKLIIDLTLRTLIQQSNETIFLLQ